MRSNPIEKNNPLSEEQYLVTCLAEECAEVAERAAKVLRFGRYDVEEGQELTNEQRLAQELNDLLAVVELLDAECGLRLDRSEHLVAKKKDKVLGFMRSRGNR